MATFLNDTFTEGANTSLDLHTGEVGATWTKHPLSGAGTVQVLASVDEIYGNGTMPVLYYASGLPAAADYDVEGVFRHISSSGNSAAIAARMDPAADTMYLLEYNATTGVVSIIRRAAGASTTLVSAVHSIGSGLSGTLKLSLRGTGADVVLTAFLNGAQILTATDSAANRIVAAGRAGVRFGTSTTGTTRVNISSITAADPLTLVYLDIPVASFAFSAGDGLSLGEAAVGLLRSRRRLNIGLGI